MKSRLMTFIIAFILILMPITVNAENKLTVDCPKNKINMGEKLTCSIKASSDDEIGGVDLTVSVSGNLEIVSVEKSSEWQGSVNNNRMALYWDKVDVKTTEFGTITVKAVNNFTNADGKILLQKSPNSGVDGIELTVNRGDAATVANVEQLVTINGSKTSSNNTVYIAFGIAAVVVIVIVAIIVLKNKKKK